MKKRNKRKTASEKLEILDYAKLHGTTKASRDFNVSIGSLYDWSNIYDSEGIEGLSGRKKEDAYTVENRRLKRENDELKKLVAEKELELKIKNVMLEKKRSPKKIGK